MKEIRAFTGETLLFDEIEHHYYSLSGKRLMSPSKYKKIVCEQVDFDKIAGFVAKKHKVSVNDVLDMWARNGEISTSFGTALHLAMEQWFTHQHEKGTEKGYNLPKSQYLRDAVMTFPMRDSLVLPERVVYDPYRLWMGKVDGIHIVDDGVVDVYDFKSDARVEKNLEEHAIQLNFYRLCIEASGLWRVRNMIVWGFDGVWSPHYVRIQELELI